MITIVTHTLNELGMMGGKWYYTSPVCSIKNICVTLRGRIKETARTAPNYK